MNHWTRLQDAVPLSRYLFTYFSHLRVLHKRKMKGWGQNFQFAKLRLLKSLEYSTSFLCNEISTCAKPAVLLFLMVIIFLLAKAELVPAVSAETCNWTCNLPPANRTRCTCTGLQSSQAIHNPRARLRLSPSPMPPLEQHQRELPHTLE